MWVEPNKKTESNPVKNSESNQVRNNELNQVRHGKWDQVIYGESNQVGNDGQRGTANANDVASSGYLTWQWVGSWKSNGVIAVIVTPEECRYRRRRCRRRLCRTQAGLHVTGPWSGSIGASFVPTDWWVRVFGPSCIVYIPSDRLYIQTIPLSGCMYRHSHCSHRCELPGNYPVFNVVMAIYHCVEIIRRILVTTNFLYNIYYHEKYYPDEPVDIHMQSLINIIQEKNWVINTKKW